MDDRKALAQALGRIPSGLFILTLRHGEQQTGMLLSWVQQCSFEPPLVTFAVKKGRFAGEWLVQGAAATLNALRDDQSALISHFGKGFEPGQPAFQGLAVQQREDRAPILEQAHAYLDTRLVQREAAGDHELFIAEVVAGAVLQEGKPYVHVRKNGLTY